MLELTLLFYYKLASLELCLPAVPRSGVILMSCILRSVYMGLNTRFCYLSHKCKKPPSPMMAYPFLGRNLNFGLNFHVFGTGEGFSKSVNLL